MSKSTAEIRQTFLDFFKSKGHEVVASSSLVPDNDPTLLFTNAGMNQFKNVFLGQDKRDYSRATSSQRCVRAGGKHNDLENVGYTARHHTFFEMLGNFSFGDYFKQQAINFAWELLTGKEWFNLPSERLWVTVYHTDDEAYQIWADEIGVPEHRIIRIGDNKGSAYASDNFWQMGDTGPCGPCSEIFYDHGPHIWGGPPGSPEEEGDRYIEIWNIVFMQFNRQADGSMQPLPKPSVDTGMGLERISAVLQHANSNYEIDVFQSLIQATANIIGTADLTSKSLRVIADHIRSCAFLIADGVIPSNENRGYVLRRIIRRAVRHGNMLGAEQGFFWKLVAPLVEVMASAGELLQKQQQHVEEVIRHEEEQFAQTLDRGLALLDEELNRLTTDTLDGAIVFRLYDTFGFPADLTNDICRERNLKIDEAGFTAAMNNQRQKARQASGFAIDYSQQIHIDQQSTFDGYDHLTTTGTVIGLFIAGQPVHEVTVGQPAIVVLDTTPFYGESGGQVGDSGTLSNEFSNFKVDDTQKISNSLGHQGQLLTGCLRIGDKVRAVVNAERRQSICLNHTATHLLHKALREVLGEHVTQKGSLVNEHQLRFDFSHSGVIQPEQLQAITQRVNQQIRCNLPVCTEIMDIDTAKQRGAMALFGEKYSQQVRVLTMGDFSIELCGGTHAKRSGDLGLFSILSESGTAAGVRRIEAVTGQRAIELMLARDQQLSLIAQQVKSGGQNIAEKVQQLVEQLRQLEKNYEKLKSKQIARDSASLAEQATDIKGNKLLVCELNGFDAKQLRMVMDDLKNQLQSAVIILASVVEGKIALIAGVSKNLIQRIKAGDIIRELAKEVGGKGGGRPDMAQAGGSDVAALPEALNKIKRQIEQELQ